jgi:hypothetical protein
MVIAAIVALTLAFVTPAFIGGNPPQRSRLKTHSLPRASATPPTRASEVTPASSEPVVANQEDSAFAALTELVTTRMREWEADDVPELRDARIQELERLLAANRPKITDRLKVIEALPGNLMDFVFGLPSFQQWIFSEPKAALDWMSRHPEISEARLLALFQDWGGKDRAEYQRYLAELPEGEWKQKVMMAASYEALPGDPVEAINRMRQLNAGRPQTGLLEMATAEWARSDPAAAGRWVSQVRDPVLQEHLTAFLAAGYAETAPEFSATWAIQSVPPGKNLDRSLAEIAGAWAKQDPVAASAWVARFPPGEGRKMAVGNLVNAWVNRDRAAALAWIRDLPEGALRNEAAQFAELDLAVPVSP